MRVIALALCFLFVADSCQDKKHKPLSDETTELEEYDPLTPALWGYTDSVIIKGYLDSSIFKANHPLDVGRHALFILHAQPDWQLENGRLSFEPYLEFLKNYKYRIETNDAVTYAYGFDHHEMKKGQWWSAMANTTIALAFWKGFEISRDSTYYCEFEKVLNGVLNTTKENGCTIQLGDSATWYLEYAETITNPNNGYFVLNGFLYALVNLKTIANETGLTRAQQAYEKGVSAFLKKRVEYYYDSTKWTKYMLNPVTIEPTHYAIFDILLFESLKTLDSHHDTIWNKELKRRRDLLRTTYPVLINEDDSLFFSALGPPHPYWIDTYSLTIKMNFADGSTENYYVKNPRNLEVGLMDRAFHVFPLSDDKELQSLQLFSVYSGDSVLLYNNEKLDYIIDTLLLHKSNATWSLYQGEVERVDGNWRLSNPADSISKHIDFNAALNSKLVNRAFYYGFTLNHSFQISSLRILLIDHMGNSAERYYQRPVPRKNNFIVFHPTGFKQVDKLDFTKPITVRVMMYYKAVDDENSHTFELGDLNVFESTFEVRNFIREQNVVLPEKTKRGNIY